jgi:hypothetical protein
MSQVRGRVRGQGPFWNIRVYVRFTCTCIMTLVHGSYTKLDLVAITVYIVTKYMYM